MDKGIKAARLGAFGCPLVSHQSPVIFAVPHEGQSALVALQGAAGRHGEQSMDVQSCSTGTLLLGGIL
jgi:hypothetical protein